MCCDSSLTTRGCSDSPGGVQTHLRRRRVFNSDVFKLTCTDAEVFKLTWGVQSRPQRRAKVFKFTCNDAEVFKLTRNDAEVFKLTRNDAERFRLSCNDTEVFKLTLEGRGGLFRLACSDSPLSNDDAERSINSSGTTQRCSDSPGTTQRCPTHEDGAEVFQTHLQRCGGVSNPPGRTPKRRRGVQDSPPERRSLTCNDAPRATRASDHPRHSDMSGRHER
jgi:hypothetical protein